MFYRILNVTPVKNFLLRIDFQNVKTKYFDVALLFAKWNTFKKLKDTPELFWLVQVDPGG